MYFKRKHITMPTVTPADVIVQAAKELVDALKAQVLPLLMQPSTEQLKQLSNIFTPNKQEPVSQQSQQ